MKVLGPSPVEGARPRALRERGRPFAASVGVGAVMLAMCLLPTSRATAGLARHVDGEGIIHFTNAPEDPRDPESGRRAGPQGLSGPFAKEIREMSSRYDVDPALVEAIVRAESSFDPSAVSRRGAAGLMQLMPRTASALGVGNRFDPRESIRGGVRHLRYLLDRYRGDVALAVAAYNAGEGAIALHRGIPPYPETVQYVQRVLENSRRSHSDYRFYKDAGADGTLTYSNLPPGLRPRPLGR